MSGKAKTVLITGGDGYLGSSLAARYLLDTDERVLLWFRAGGAEEFQNKKAALRRRFAAHGDRVDYAAGDLLQDEPFRALDPAAVGAVIHAAAVTRFNVEEAAARRVNLEGTRKILRFAAGCPALETFGLLSTVYASGLASGVIAEAPLDDRHGFANFYEWSKWAAETALLEEFDDLPWRIFRVATIIAHDSQGAVLRQNAFHNTLKLLYNGLLSVVPGQPETPLYLVSGEFVARAIFSLMRSPSSRAVYHVCHTREESLRLGGLVDAAFEAFERSGDFRRRRILKPLYSDLASFELLADGVEKFSGGVVAQAVASVAPFARQLFVDKDIKNERLTAALGPYPDPETRRLVGVTCRLLVQSGWKRTDYDAR